MSGIGSESGLRFVDVNVLALVKGQERYVFLYTDEYRVEMLRLLGRYAGNPDLSFSWYDAAVLSQRIRHISEEDHTKDVPQKYIDAPEL